MDQSPTTVTGHALALHTDLANIRDYSGLAAVRRELVLVAEERLAVISSHLSEVRRTLGMNPSGLVIEA